MLECWNGGLEGLGGLESLEFRPSGIFHPPLPLCVKIILSQSRDSFLNLVNPVNPVKKVRLCASEPLCLCVNFITETQRHRVFFILLCPSASLPLCVKILLSQSRDSFPNLVNPVYPVKGELITNSELD